MAQCQSEKKLSPSGFDTYGGMFSGKVYGATANGKIDRFQGWSRYNAATLSDTRIGSFSKEDSFNLGSLYGASFHSGGLDTPSRADLMNGLNGSTKGVGLKVGGFAVGDQSDRPGGTDSPSTGDLKADASASADGAKIKHARSASSGVPPSGGFTVKGGIASSPNARGGSSPGGGLPALVSSSTEGSFRKENYAGHRRGVSDVGDGRIGALFNGENKSGGNRSGEILGTGSESGRYSGGSDSGRYSSGGSSSKDGSSGGASPTVLSLKVGESTTKDNANAPSSSGGSSRGSSVAGSPTVARTSSAESLFSSGGSLTGGSSSAWSPTTGATFRSSGGNVGNVLGPASQGTGLHTGGSVPSVATPRTPICHGGRQINGGTVAPTRSLGGAGISGNVLNGGSLVTGPLKGRCKPEGAKAADSTYGRGNIFAAGESLLIKRQLSSTDPEEVKNAGNDQYKKGNFAEALSLYDRAISLAPGRAPYRSNRAAALTGLGRLAEAVRECEDAIKLDPSYVRAHQRLASLYMRLGRVEKAKKHFKSSGQQADLGDMLRMEKIEKHVTKCLEARRLSDWSTVVRESDAAVVAGADSAPQVLL